MDIWIVSCAVEEHLRVAFSIETPVGRHHLWNRVDVWVAVEFGEGGEPAREGSVKFRVRKWRWTEWQRLRGWWDEKRRSTLTFHSGSSKQHRSRECQEEWRIRPVEN